MIIMCIELPRLGKCCCCLSLRTGSLVIGYLSLVASSIFLTLVSVALYTVVLFVRSHRDMPDPNHTPEELERTALGLYISHGYLMLVFLYSFVISLLLVIGVHKKLPKYMRYYFNSGLLLLVLACVLVVVSFIFMGFVATVPLLNWAVILFYCLLVVRSAYLEMEEYRKPIVYEMQSLYSPPAPLIL